MTSNLIPGLRRCRMEQWIIAVFVNSSSLPFLRTTGNPHDTWLLSSANMSSLSRSTSRAMHKQLSPSCRSTRILYSKLFSPVSPVSSWRDCSGRVPWNNQGRGQQDNVTTVVNVALFTLACLNVYWYEQHVPFYSWKPNLTKLGDNLNSHNELNALIRYCSALQSFLESQQQSLYLEQ